MMMMIMMMIIMMMMMMMMCIKREMENQSVAQNEHDWSYKKVIVTLALTFPFALQAIIKGTPKNNLRRGILRERLRHSLITSASLQKGLVVSMVMPGGGHLSAAKGPVHKGLLVEVQ